MLEELIDALKAYRLSMEYTHGKWIVSVYLPYRMRIRHVDLLGALLEIWGKMSNK